MIFFDQSKELHKVIYRKVVLLIVFSDIFKMWSSWILSCTQNTFQTIFDKLLIRVSRCGENSGTKNSTFVRSFSSFQTNRLLIVFKYKYKYNI